VRFKVLGRDRPGVKNRMRADRHSRPDKRTGPDPRASLHDDRFHDQIKCGRFVIMIPGAQQSALGNANMILEGDSITTKQPAYFAEPHMVADLELPGEGDFDVWLDHHSLADARAEQTQDPAFQRVKPERTELKKPQAHQQPEELGGPACTAIKVSGRKR